MTSKRQRRAQEEDARKYAVKRALEKQFEMPAGILRPKPVPHLGKFTFVSKRQQTRYQLAMSRGKLPPAK